MQVTLQDAIKFSALAHQYVGAAGREEYFKNMNQYPLRFVQDFYASLQPHVSGTESEILIAMSKELLNAEVGKAYSAWMLQPLN